MRPILSVTWWKWLALAIAIVLVILALVRPWSTAKVASVDGHDVTLSSFHEWLSVAAASAHTSDKELPGFVPDAPNYSRCVTYEHGVLSAAHKTAPSNASLAKDCAEIRASLSEQVMEFLLGAQWFIAEGSREGISVSSAQVQKALHTSFPKTTGLTQFLNDSGMTQTNLAYQARVSLIAEKLSKLHSGPTPTVTSAEIAAYYAKYKADLNHETLAQATPIIREAIIAEAQAPDLDAWESQLQRYYQPRTACGSGYRISYYCRSAS